MLQQLICNYAAGTNSWPPLPVGPAVRRFDATRYHGDEGIVSCMRNFRPPPRLPARARIRAARTSGFRRRPGPASDDFATDMPCRRLAAIRDLPLFAPGKKEDDDGSRRV